MANRKLSNSFLGISADANTTSEATNFPKENAINRTSPQRHWRSTVTTDTRLVINLGAVQTNLTCYLDDVNFSSFKYQESADGSSGWSDIGATKTVEKDPMHGIYRRTDDITLTGKQYLGILIDTQTPVDNAGYFRIGTFAIPMSVVELDAETTVEYPYDVTLPSSHIVENRFPTGKTEKIKLGRLQPMVISFALKTGVHQNIKGQAVQEISNLLRDPTNTIFLDFNLGESWQAYLVKKSGDLRASLSTPATGTADFGSVLFDVIT
ncbi:MAG: hypothetical protein DHS20C13_02850 [Thermodesulfobacteriota bacterium]|nr:MAG: hypothetical protein DHS20C13_02850 [Thermodesulfobacteriota bacterium]